MEGKRFRHTLLPSYNIGGLIQFEDGYWPPLTKPPCTDPGLCSYVERSPNFGTPLLHECEEGPEPTQRELDRIADLSTRAEAAVARLHLQQPPAPPEAPAPDILEALPTPSEIKAMSKKRLLQTGERFGIADHQFRESTKIDMVKAIMAEIAAIEE